MAASRSWKISKSHVRAYTGGPIHVENSEKFVAALCGERVAVLDVATGAVIRTLPESSGDVAQEPVVNCVVSPTSGSIVTASRSSLIRVWDVETGTILKEFKGPRGIVNSMAFDPTGTLLAIGSSDRSVMVFDVDKKYCTHNFKGHEGMVTLVRFHPDRKALQLVSVGDDCKLMMWDLRKNACIAKVKDHYSLPTAVAFAATEAGSWYMFTAGRDQVIHVYSLDDRKVSLVNTTPAFEVLEGLEVIGVQGEKVSFVTGGVRGQLRVWTCQSGASGCRVAMSRETSVGKLLGAPFELAPEVLEAPVSQQITSVLHAQGSSSVVCVTADHTLVFVDVATLALCKTLVGNNDDVIDVKYIPSLDLDGTTSSRIAVATNSEQLRLFDVNSFDCTVLAGHSESILSVDVSPDGKFVATASKDKTARIWDAVNGKCVGICEGHTMAVGAVAFPKRAKAFHEGQCAWMVTGSKDRTLKVWNIASLLDGGPKKLKHKAGSSDEEGVLALRTICAVAAHDKDLNQLAVSPNDALIASASQDKTVKLWKPADLSLVGVLRGHKRGVWAVEFSPVDRVVASASGDQTIRLWSVTDFSCIRTLEGHTSSVLCLKFLRLGTQLVSGAADGLLKLWNIRDSECVNTIKGHEDRIWTVSMAKCKEIIPAEAGSGQAEGYVIVERNMVTGGGDSVISVWRDATEEECEAEREKAEALVLEQQELFNRMAARDYERTVELCIKLEQPLRLQAVLSELLEYGPAPSSAVDYSAEALAEYEEMKQESTGLIWQRHDDGFLALREGVATDRRSEGAKKLVSVLASLTVEHLDRLLRYVRDWNTQSKHNLFAQQVLFCALRSIPSATLKSCPSFPDIVKAIIPYSERHFERMNRMLQSSYFMDYVQSRMMIAMPEAAALFDASTAAMASALATAAAPVVPDDADDALIAKRVADDEVAVLESEAVAKDRKRTQKSKKARKIETD